MAETPSIAALVARAIVHLNFNEPEQAQTVLFLALTEINFAPKKEINDGDAAYAA